MDDNSTMTTETKTALATGAAVAKKSANSAFTKVMTPSAALAEVIGSTPIPRTEVVKQMWVYIKAHGLQDEKNKRNVNADAKLRPIFGKDQGPLRGIRLRPAQRHCAGDNLIRTVRSLDGSVASPATGRTQKGAIRGTSTLSSACYLQPDTAVRIHSAADDN
jgi:upstream activation factor subunit UAF30